ncbi:TetR/AcrR family transcriptional regulator [Sphaerisporangium sp. NPDC004334]
MNDNPGPDHAAGRARPGRKRSEDSRRAILAAAFQIFTEAGYAGLTVEGIAARAGCGKQTIYRWWKTKADVLFDALAQKSELHIPLTDTGTYEGDLRAFLTATFALGDTPQVRDMLCALMAEAQIDPEFGERFRAAFLQRRRDALGVVLGRARARGGPGPVPGLSTSTIMDIVFGTLWYRVLATREPLDHALVEELLAVLAPSRD